jgi:hypothetical protein
VLHRVHVADDVQRVGANQRTTNLQQTAAAAKYLSRLSGVRLHV